MKAKYVALALAPIAIAASCYLAWGGRDSILRPVTLASQGLGLAGAAAAAFTFGARDRMRWAWLCLVGLFTLNFTHLLLNPEVLHMSGEVGMLAIAVYVLVNVLNTIALSLFVHAVFSSGLAPAWRWWAALGGFVVALAVVGSSLWAGLQGHQPMSTLIVISSLGDVASLTLLGPLLGTALWMRGGSLAWVYGLLTVESLVWLGFDVMAEGTSPLAKGITAFAPILAWMYVGAAGLAHRWAVKGA